MKNFFKTASVAILVAFGVSYFTGWPIWTILVFLGLGYGFYTLRSGHPQIAKWLAVVVVVTLAGSWAWSYFGENFPLSFRTLKYGKNQLDTRLSGVMDPGLSKARAVLIRELRKKEDALAAEIPALMATNHEEVIKRTQELKKLRKTIDELFVELKPVPAKATPLTASTYTVNQGEVISTLSVPNNSTIYMEADKAFCILEKNGANPDGTEILSRLTFPPGKSKRYFAWGGVVRVVGLETNTTIKMHL